MPDYKLGKDDPHYIEDYGSGPWCTLCSEHTNGHVWSMFKSLLLSFEKIRKTAEVERILQYLNKDGNYIKVRYPVATSHLKHYFENHGGLRSDPEDIFYEKKAMQYFMDVSLDLNTIFNRELIKAKRFCEKISLSNPPEKWYDITSSSVGQGNFIRSNEDLFLAIGGYQFWGKGKLYYKEVASSLKAFYFYDKFGRTHNRARYQYQLIFEFVLFDRYNWNKGQRVGLLSPVTDDDFGRYHQLGLAREYNIWGKFSEQYTWLEGTI